VGDVIGGIVVYRHVTNDADSVLVAFYEIADTPTDGGAFIPAVPTGGLHYIDQATITSI
jgi:hypothetical protein